MTKDLPISHRQKYVSEFARSILSAISGFFVGIFSTEWAVWSLQLSRQAQIEICIAFAMVTTILVWLSIFVLPMNRWFKAMIPLGAGTMALVVLLILLPPPPPKAQLPTPSLSGIAIVSQDDAWAVGDGGTILHYSAGGWKLHSVSGVSEDFDAITMVNSSDGWATTVNGPIFHYDGIQWNQFTSSFVGDLHSVWMISPSQGWMVGGNGSTSAVLQFNNGSWEPVLPPPVGDAYLSGVDFLSANEGWAVGQKKGIGTIWHYLNGHWIVVPIAYKTGALTAIAMTSSTQGWAVSINGTILHYNGTSWIQFNGPNTYGLDSISMLPNGDEGWAVGTDDTILHYDGLVWRLVHQDHSGDVLTRVAVVPSSNGIIGWAVGSDGIFRCLNGTWTRSEL